METSRREQAQNDLGYNFKEEDSKYSQVLEKEELRREKKLRKREELLESSSYRMVSGIAKYWDNWFLDPIVGLFLPGFGDFITTTLGLPAIWMSLTKIRSLPLTLAVIYNLVVDMLIGLIPFYIGDICDAFNKANKKNMKLIVGFIEDDEEIISKVNRKAVFFGIMIIVLCFIIYYAIKFVISMGHWHVGLHIRNYCLMENKVFQQQIKERTGWSDAIVRFLHSREEAEVYIKAGLVERRIGGRAALVRTDIDWRAFNCRQEWLKEKFADWDKWQDYNNADLIGEGWPPRDSNGDPYELHHIGQQQDSPFAELTWKEHMGDGNNAILHPNRESVIDRQQFDGEKSRYWQDRFKAFSKEEIKRIYH